MNTEKIIEELLNLSVDLAKKIVACLVVYASL